MENVGLVNLSSQMSMRRTLDVVANNLANLNTTAFKAETLHFEERAESVGGNGAGQDQILFVMDFGLSRNLEEGAMQPTGDPLDVAISGEGFFVVNTPDGERYTRNGKLALDIDGRLVTHSGYPVLDSNGEEIFLENDGRPLTISKTGVISAEGEGEIGANGEEAQPQSLMIVRFDAPNELVKDGDSLMRSDEVPQPAEGFRVLQGTLEGSNVNAIGEMTKMIQTMRAYQGAMQSGKDAHDMSTKAIERLGRTNA